MGSRGPAPTPTPILKARGSKLVGGRAGEVQFNRDAPTRPAFLAGEGAEEWDRQVAELDAAGVLQVVDRAMLAAWCEAWGEFCHVKTEIERALDPNTPTGDQPRRTYANLITEGLINAKNRAVERLIRLAAQFGFSPAARVRITAPEPEQEDTNGKGRFFAG